MGVVAAIAAGVSALVGAYSAYSQAQAQSRMAAYNALIAEQNAEIERRRREIMGIEKDIQTARVQRELQSKLGQQKTAWAKAGVDLAGTPLMVEAESLVRADLDALAIKYASTIEQAQSMAREAGLKQEAMLQRMRGRSASMAGYLGAGQSLLTGGAQVYGIGKQEKWW